MADKSILVTAGIIRDKKKILIAKRTKESSLEALKWEFPGGKIEFMEKPEDCLKRELKEELDIEIDVDRVFSVESHVYIKDGMRVHVILIVFLCDYVSGEIKLIDCADARFVTKKEMEEIAENEWAGADVQIKEKVLANWGTITF